VLGKSSPTTLSKAGWSLGWVSAVDSSGQTIWIVETHRGDGKRFIVHADEKLSAFVELERVTRESFPLPKCRVVGQQFFHDSAFVGFLPSK
jgi:hypothetical protein